MENGNGTATSTVITTTVVAALVIAAAISATEPEPSAVPAVEFGMAVLTATLTEAAAY